ncbi:MAG: DUF1080 domain-containing protein [Limnohabitans sp.]
MQTLLHFQRLRIFGLSIACMVLQGCSTMEDWAHTARQNLSSNAAVKGTALINGKDLNAWKLVGNANWRLQDGVVQAELGDGFLITRNSFQNFHLVAEFWVDEEANSGIFFRCTDPLVINDKTAYEANIYDKRPDTNYGTGTIVGVAKSLIQPNLKTGGQWNTYDITVVGTRMTLVLNGQTTVDTNDSTHTDAGPIALQYNKGVVKFRKLNIESL